MRPGGLQVWFQSFVFPVTFTICDKNNCFLPIVCSLLYIHNFATVLSTSYFKIFGFVSMYSLSSNFSFPIYVLFRCFLRYSNAALLTSPTQRKQCFTTTACILWGSLSFWTKSSSPFWSARFANKSIEMHVWLGDHWTRILR